MNNYTKAYDIIDKVANCGLLENFSTEVFYQLVLIVESELDVQEIADQDL